MRSAQTLYVFLVYEYEDRRVLRERAVRIEYRSRLALLFDCYDIGTVLTAEIKFLEGLADP